MSRKSLRRNGGEITFCKKSRQCCNSKDIIGNSREDMHWDRDSRTEKFEAYRYSQLVCRGKGGVEC
jgi:hypothetical protein